MKKINEIFNIFKVGLLMLLVLMYSSIPIFIFRIDFNSLSPIMQIVYYLVCDITFMLIIFLMYRKTFINDVKEYFKDFKNNFEVSFKYWFAGFVVMVISNLLITIFFTGANAGNEENVRSMISDAPIYMLFAVGIYAPFVEEMVFRKAFREIFKSKYVYIIMSGVVFGSLHVISSISSPSDLLYLIPYSALGIAFASLYYKTDNIFSSMIMHSIHNTAAALIYILGSGILWKSFLRLHLLYY